MSLRPTSASPPSASITDRPSQVKAAPRFAMTDLAMLLVVAIWGANFAIVKAALAQIPPLAFTALRFTIASLLLLVIMRVREGKLMLPRGSMWKLIWLGVVGNTVYQVGFIYGLSITTAANSALLIAATPVIVALLGAALGLERLTGYVLAGIALAFIGMMLVMAARGAGLSVATLGGDLLVLGAAVCWSIYTLGVRSLGAELSPLQITAWTLVTGTPGLILLGVPELLRTNWQGINVIGWGGLAYASLLALVVAYVLWNSSVRRVGSSRTAVYACITPLIAAFVAWGLLGERPQPLQGVGAALIICGVLLTKRKGKAALNGTKQDVDELVHTSAPA